VRVLVTAELLTYWPVMEILTLLSNSVLELAPTGTVTEVNVKLRLVMLTMVGFVTLSQAVAAVLHGKPAPRGRVCKVVPLKRKPYLSSSVAVEMVASDPSLL
jgi:hypothetical protein